jgi:hypothetical protein
MWTGTTGGAPRTGPEGVAEGSSAAGRTLGGGERPGSRVGGTSPAGTGVPSPTEPPRPPLAEPSVAGTATGVGATLSVVLPGMNSLSVRGFAAGSPARTGGTAGAPIPTSAGEGGTILFLSAGSASGGGGGGGKPPTPEGAPLSRGAAGGGSTSTESTCAPLAPLPGGGVFFFVESPRRDDRSPFFSGAAGAGFARTEPMPRGESTGGRGFSPGSGGGRSTGGSLPSAAFFSLSFGGGGRSSGGRIEPSVGFLPPAPSATGGGRSGNGFSAGLTGAEVGGAAGLLPFPVP